MSSLEQQAAINRKRDRIASFKKNSAGWLIMAPSLILFCFYVWVPLFSSIQLSLFKTKGVRLDEFVGFKNYLSVFRHPDFLAAVKNTFVYCGWSLVIGFLIPIIMALIISEIVHCKGFFRIGSYFPNIVPGLATVFMWKYIFDAADNGTLNLIVGAFGVEPQKWLVNAAWVIPLIVVTMTWKGAGATALIYLASLQGINQELYEAAAIDGAGIWNRVRYITVPNLFNMARTLLILQIISVFQILYEPVVMTNGGPNNASISIMQLVYNYAYTKGDYAKAAAVSVVICLFLIIITVLYNKFVKAKDM